MREQIVENNVYKKIKELDDSARFLEDGVNEVTNENKKLGQFHREVLLKNVGIDPNY